MAATLHDYTLVCPSGGQRIHRAESHVCHVIEPGAVRTVFPGLAVSRAVALRPAGTARARRARSAGWPRRCAGSRPAPTTAAGAALGRTGRRSSTAPTIERRLAAARTAFADFDVAVAPSASLAREYAALGFPIERVVVSDYGFAPLARPPRTADPDGRLRIGFVGTLVWHKGADVLIDAVAASPARSCRRPHLRRPRCLPGLRRHAAAAAPWVCRCGSWAASITIGAEAIFAQMDVLVVASRWLENSPLVIHEAFMAGVPVVGTAIGGIVDLLDHGRHGILVPPDDPDALAAALARADRRAVATRRDRAHARRRVKSIEQDADEWRAALRGHRRRRRRRGGDRVVTPEVSIVVPTRNGAATLPALIEAHRVAGPTRPRAS